MITRPFFPARKILFLAATLALSTPAFSADETKAVAETPLMTSKTMPRILDLDAPLKGAKDLWLVVSDEGSLSCDWSDWIEPKLIMADGSVKDLTTLAWKSAKSGSGKVSIGKNYAGGPLLVDKKTVASGIGTHAPSTIVFELPAGVERFTAKVAIDDGGMVRAGKPSDASVRFHVYTQKPSETQQGDLNAGPTFVPPEMFTVPEGFEVTLWATSPLLFNPTNMDFDAQGRLYVAEGVNYRGKAGRRPEGDRIVAYLKRL